MKKIKLLLISLLTTFVILSGCTEQNNDGANNNLNNAANTDADNNTEQTENEATVVVTLTKNDNEEIISEREIEVSEGDILLDVMVEDFDAKHDNGFITSIDGVEADDPNEEGWLYYVNGDEAPVGAGEYELSDNDNVRFDFQKWN